MYALKQFLKWFLFTGKEFGTISKQILQDNG
jgi:hypothetical protein